MAGAFNARAKWQAVKSTMAAAARFEELAALPKVDIEPNRAPEVEDRLHVFVRIRPP